MNHRHRKVLQSIFAHPVSGNIRFRDVEHVLEELGATLTNKSGARIGVELNGHSVALHAGSHDLNRDEVAQIRDFLTTAGIDPAAYPA